MGIFGSFVNIANSRDNSYIIRKEMKERSKESKEIYKSQRRKKKKGKRWAVRGCLRGVVVGRLLAVRSVGIA